MQKALFGLVELHPTGFSKHVHLPILLRQVAVKDKTLVGLVLHSDGFFRNAHTPIRVDAALSYLKITFRQMSFSENKALKSDFGSNLLQAIKK